MKEIQKKWDNICSSAKTEFSHKKKNAEKNPGIYVDNYIYHVNTSSYAFFK